MSDTDISRRGLVLGGLALMLSGCTQATGAMSTQVTGAIPLANPERPPLILVSCASVCSTTEAKAPARSS